MANQENDTQDQPKYLTHEDLNGALASQKRDFQKLMQQMQQQNADLIATLQSTLGQKPEAAPLPSKSETVEDVSTLKKQISTLLERDKQRDASEKQMKMEKALRDTLAKHGINTRSDLAISHLQNQVSFDEDGQLVMKCEVAPGVIQPLPIGEAVSKFAQSEHGKFLADAKDIRGSGSRDTSAPHQFHQTTQSNMVESPNGGAPVFSDVNALRNYAKGFVGNKTLKY